MVTVSNFRTALFGSGSFVRLSLRLLGLRGLIIIRSFGGPVI
jgi:hypothetical protein